MKFRNTPIYITSLPTPNHIYVFGSNLAGKPGAGAAKFAQRFGMRYGHCEGICGNTYAIPTKDKNIQSLPLTEIAKYVEAFTIFAHENPQLIFWVTAIGTGLAGYTVEEIAPFFEKASGLQNVFLPESFNKHFEMKYKSNFEYDLKVGNMGEEKIHKMLADAKLEIKTDFIALRTGNVFVEYECAGKKSGIATSNADYWCFILSETVMVFCEINALKAKCRKHLNTKRDKLGGDNDASKGILLPITELLMS